TVAAIIMGRLGALELATHQVVVNIYFAASTVLIGLSSAGAIRVGQAIGGSRRGRMRVAIVVTHTLIAACGMAAAVAHVAAPDALLRMFTADQAVITLGATLLLALALVQIADGLQFAGAAAIHGAADTRMAALT